MEEEHVVKEANLRETVTHLTKDNGRLSNLSVERMQMIQVKGTDFLQSLHHRSTQCFRSLKKSSQTSGERQRNPKAGEKMEI